MLGPRVVLSIASTIAALSVLGCDENPAFQKLGSMEITTSAPAVEKEIATVDGWVVKYDRFLVHVSSVEVAGSDTVLAASSSSQIVDQVAPGTKSLLSATVRTARAWEDVRIQIGPAVADAETPTTFLAPATEADVVKMQAGGFSIYVEGKLSKAGLVKTFAWGLTTDTVYEDCQDTRDGAVVRGLVVPADGNDTADIGLAGELLFSDNLAEAGVIRADAIAAADANGDGAVTFDELRAAPIDLGRTFGGTYAIGAWTGVVDLAGFVEAQSQSLVSRYRSAGTCTAEPVVVAP